MMTSVHLLVSRLNAERHATASVSDKAGTPPYFELHREAAEL